MVESRGRPVPKILGKSRESEKFEKTRRNQQILSKLNFELIEARQSTSPAMVRMPSSVVSGISLTESILQTADSPRRTPLKDEIN
jgi:hypothetical protein